jgi:Ca2+-binding EF-hand superfamily protein
LQENVTEELKEAFKVFDRNQDGYISANEVKIIANAFWIFLDLLYFDLYFLLIVKEKTTLDFSLLELFKSMIAFIF